MMSGVPDTKSGARSAVYEKRRVVEGTGSDASGEEEPHGLEFAREGIEDEAEILQRDNAEERLVAVLAEYDRGVAVGVGEGDVGFGDLALNGRAVGQGEELGALGFQAKPLPHVLGQQRV